MAMTGSKIEPYADEDSTINTEDHEIEPYAVEDSTINMKDHEIEPFAVENSTINMEDHEIEPTAADDSVINMEDHEIEATLAEDSVIHMEDHEIEASAAEDSAVNMEDHKIEASTAKEDTVIHMECHEIEEASTAEDTAIHMDFHEIEEASVAEDTAIHMECHEIEEVSAGEDTTIHMECHEIEPSAAEDHSPNEETFVDVDAKLQKTYYLKRKMNNLVRRVKIPRVPKRLRGGEDDSYEPKIISFGPYHRGLDRLKDMEKHKERYLQTILLRCRCLRGELKNKIKELLEGDVRRCYSEDIGGLGLGFEEENGEFLNMMMLDCCFIVEYLIQWHLGIGDAELDDMMCGVHNLVRHDMFLLENQLPFSLLEHIFNHVREYQRQLSQFTFMTLCITYFEDMWKIKIILPPLDADHLLHLYHSTLCVNCTNANDDNDYVSTITGQGRKENTIWDAMKKREAIAKEKVRTMDAAHTGAERKQREEKGPRTIPSVIVLHEHEITFKKNEEEKGPRTIPSATVLHEHGITFKKNEAEGSSIIDIKFHKGVLEIPLLVIGDSTKSLFRNLIAFEQLSPRSNVGSEYNFTTYVRFLNFIINTPEDVALLCRKGILEHYLGSDKDVAYLFNNLTFGTFWNADYNYLSKLFKDVKEYQNLFWPRWRANLMRNYFNTPWAGLSVAAAVSLLVAAIAQTVFTGISTF